MAGIDDRFDVVIVGARCAGAALAQRLAATGCTIALVDSAPRASGQPMSTHLIQPPGMDELDALGVGARVRDLSPALRAVRMEFDGREVAFPYGDARPAHCLRRTELDVLLQDAAVEAGASLQTEARVVGLLRTTNGRVCGVDVQSRGSETRQLHADLVVGADGRNSTVAKLVGAEEYLGYDGPRGCYWAYWNRPSDWDAHSAYNSFAGDASRVVFPTDAGLLLVATAPPVDRARVWRGDHRAAYLADIRSHAPIASFLGNDQPVSKVRGIALSRYFFRTSAGDGWALLGDAGHHKEFIVGLGISDALRDARSLADAIVDGRPAALEGYWRARDAERMPLFHWSRDLGAADDVDALERLMAERSPADPVLLLRLGAVLDGRLSPYALVPPSRALRWVAGEVLQGRTDAIRPLLRTAQRMAHAQREVRRRRRLADRISAELGPDDASSSWVSRSGFGRHRTGPGDLVGAGRSPGVRPAPSDL